MIENVKIKLVDMVTCPENWSWESGKNGWNGYHIWFVEGGGATIQVEGTTYYLHSGDSFLFDLKKNHFCTHDPKHPLQVTTIYFQTEIKEKHIKNHQIVNDPVLGEMICRCVRLYKENELFAETYLKSVLVEFLMEHTAERNVSSVVTKIQSRLEINPHELYSLEDMKKITGYSKNQIIRYFKKDTGMTPIQYQMQQKMNFAAKMLLYSDKTVTEIGEEVGMKEANYFSKVFKKYMGKSPRNYRLQVFESEENG